MNREVDKHIANHLHYYKHLQKVLDAHKTKTSSITLRKQWLDNQKTLNYQNEYDRIRGLLSKSVVGRTEGTTDHLKAKAQELERLGAKAVFNIV